MFAGELQTWGPCCLSQPLAGAPHRYGLCIQEPGSRRDGWAVSVGTPGAVRSGDEVLSEPRVSGTHLWKEGCFWETRLVRC